MINISMIMLTFSIICRGQNGEDEVESTSLGPGDMPTGVIPTVLNPKMQTHSVHVIFTQFSWKIFRSDPGGRENL